MPGWDSSVRSMASPISFVRMFEPAAQGTIRFWSERGFFLLFEKLFGLDSLPFRLWVFFTMAANLALIAWITLRITGSRIAGFLAPVLWTANTSLTLVMTWTSAYNEALCALFLLAPWRSLFAMRRPDARVVLVVATGGFHPGLRRA